MATYTQPAGTVAGNRYFQDVEISPDTVATGELQERLSTKKYPQLGTKNAVALASFTLAVTDDEDSLTLVATATSTAAPNPLGSVEFYEGATFLGRAPLRAANDKAATIAAATVATATLSGVRGVDAGNLSAQYDGQAADVTSANVPVTAPAITSAASDTWTEDTADTFSVTTTGTPTPELVLVGTLPAGVTFVDDGDGSGTLAGTATETGDFDVDILATNGVDPDATQAFTLTVSP